MKTTRLLIAVVLAFGALAGVMWILSWGSPTIARASHIVDAPTTPLILPPPYLSEANSVDAPYGPPPTVDGRIAPGEYAVAHKLTFPGYGGNVEVFFKEDASYLYLAFDFAHPQISGSAAQVFLDTQHNGGTAPQADDYRLSVTRSGSTMENRGTGTSWGSPTAPISWTAATTTTLSGWQAEFRIEYAKLGVTAGVQKVLGLSLINAWTPGGDFYWPSGAFWTTPDTWGHLTSSSDWGAFYWKPGPWQDYAPSGMPDFDQKQNGWFLPSPVGQPLWTHCGLVAAANSLWWFDSKMETPDHAPPTISDTYPLIKTYGAWDDHDISNTVPLVNHLASYFGTNQGITGTNVISMFYGLHNYLRDRNLWDDYIVTLVPSPTFKWVADEVMRSEDVILLLGFWEWVDPDGIPGSGDEYWARVGGHFVTVAGVDPAGRIAFSDPFLDATEAGMGMIPPGRVLSGTLRTHYPPHPGADPTVHNDAGNVSHDVYPIMPTNSLGGIWGPGSYPWTELSQLVGANPHPEFPTEPWRGTPLQVEVEFALTVSPYSWKASGYQDYAPNGVPDFDQKQDCWGTGVMGICPPNPPAKYTFCGPAAAANSVWWFDSKFETKPITPPVYNDNYPLVQTYASMLPAWDDHDPLNVDSAGTPWPPGGLWPPPPPPIQPGQGEFIEDLALYFKTDAVGSGTIVTNLYRGLISYTVDHGLRQGYVFTQVKSPEFWWVAEEVERSEDVILLMGFWQLQGSNWVRLGGHYVTLPGVDKKGGLVAFSDPFFDRIEKTWPYAGMGNLPGQPAYLGRVANGWLVPHLHPAGPPDPTHNDAGNLSHDVYRVVTTTSPGGVWGPEGYVDKWPEIENFLGQNGEPGAATPTNDPIQTEVEWAVAMSPVADVWITKTVTPAAVLPGQWMTFTLVFSNAGNTAENVVISDVLPARLTNVSYTYTLNYADVLTGSDTFTWTVGTLHWNEGGIITITAQVDPNAGWPAESLITNTAGITTTTQEQYQVKPMPNSGSASFKVQIADLSIAKTAAPAIAVPGDPVTFTIMFSNTGAAATQNVVLTDALPAELSNLGWLYWTASGAAITVRPGSTYVWDLPDLAQRDWGMITVTAKISSTLSWPAVLTLTNAVTISTTTIEAAPGLPDTASATLTVQTADLQIRKTVLPTRTLTSGDWLTFTLVYSNAGPAATSVVITDLLSSRLLTATASFTFTTSYSGLLVASDHYIWQAGTVPAGGWGTITIAAQISGVLGVSSLTNQALVTGWFDRDPSNNQFMITVPLSGSTVYLPVVMKNYP